MGSEVSASFGIRVRKGFFDEQNTGNGTGGAERSLNLDDFAKSLSATLRCIPCPVKLFSIQLHL